MEQSREEILANFQACTGIEDIAEALNVLEEANWDLTNAVNQAIPFDTNPPIMIEDDDDVQVVATATGSDLNNAPRRSQRQMAAEASTSRPRSSGPRQLQFMIQYKDSHIYNVNLPDTATVVDLKQKIASKFDIPPCRQHLTGWMRTPTNDKTTLASLSLPRENMLILNSLTDATPMDLEDGETDTAERLSRQYTLNVKDDSSNKSYNLKFLGSKTILDVKTDISYITDIPVRYQIWTGWPENLKNETYLALSGVSYPSHDLTVKRALPTPDAAPSTNSRVNKESRDKHRKILIDLVDSDTSSIEEFEDASESFTMEDDIFIDNVRTRKQEPLIPDNVEDEAIGCIHFSERFTTRYGHAHPAFFTGTLEDAIKEACMKPAKDRKLLAMYLHHDGSVLSNVFCTELLGFVTVVQTFDENFVVWGWDVTNESNKSMLVSSISNNLGNVAAMTIRNLPVDRYPVLIIIMRMRSATEIFTVIHGNVGVNELVGRLLEATGVWSDQQRIEMREEQERADRELVKREQDEAYRESLEADRAKEAAKREQEAQLAEERRRIEQEQKEASAKREAQRIALESSLPPEPNGDCGDTIARIRFRLPHGQTLDRKFLGSSPLQVLLNFLTVKGFPPEEYKVISSWPRRDLTTIDTESTLNELKLCPQETVMVEER